MFIVMILNHNKWVYHSLKAPHKERGKNTRVKEKIKIKCMEWEVIIWNKLTKMVIRYNRMKEITKLKGIMNSLIMRNKFRLNLLMKIKF